MLKKKKTDFLYWLSMQQGRPDFVSEVTCHFRITIGKERLNYMETASGNYFSIQFEELDFHENRNAPEKIYLVSRVFFL